MVDEPEDLVLRMLRRMDAKLDRVLDDLNDLKQRVSSLERQVADLRHDFVALAFRVDRVEARLDRIERRLELNGAYLDIGRVP